MTKIFCPHCNLEVSQRTFRRHKQLYFDPVTKSWFENIEALLKLSTENISLQWKTDASDEEISMDYEESDVTIKNEVPVDNLTTEKEDNRQFEIWDDAEYEDLLSDISKNSYTKINMHSNSSAKSQIFLMAHWIILFLSAWSVYFNISARALESLLHFFHALFEVCGQSVPLFSTLATLIPATLYGLHKCQNTNEDQFDKMVICPSCHYIYKFENASETLFGKNKSKKCSFVEFPNHSQKVRQKPCGQVLMKEVESSNGCVTLYPHKLFCVMKIKETLKSFYKRPNFAAMCQEWRNREHLSGTYRDVYDGRVWKKFLQIPHLTEESYLSKPHAIGLMLNVDWFQPFKHSPYSAGAIYFSILNLPRRERYKKENIILAAVIPGPKEPNAHQLNNYLQPIIDELKILWKKGIQLDLGSGSITIYAALMCIACDIPAARKVAGFLGHAAKIGCSKCTKVFSKASFKDSINYGGFNTHHPARQHDELKILMEKSKSQTTKTARSKFESQSGIRFSVISELDYVDIVQFTVIDPMHNLFLGTAKFIFKTIFTEKLSDEQLLEIQQLVDNTKVSHDIGRIPLKIASGFSSFTAAQWQNWTLYFSLPCLYKRLNDDDFAMWRLFVEACYLFCKPVITVKDVREGHEKIMSFCRTFERLYSSKRVTCNMHLHTHLIDCILDFGPVYSFWLYAMERNNGILGNFPTNKRSPEVQFMRSFIRTQFIQLFTLPEIYSTELHHLIPKLSDMSTCPKLVSNELITVHKFLSTGLVKVTQKWFNLKGIKLIGKLYDGFIADHTICKHLHDCIECMIGPFQSESLVGSFTKIYVIECLGELYGSLSCRLERSSQILASWCGNDGKIDLSGQYVRPGEVLYYMKLNVSQNGCFKSLLLARVSWFQRHIESSILGTPYATVWSKSMYEPEGPCSFIPIQRITGRFLSGYMIVNRENVRVVIPKIPHQYW